MDSKVKAWNELIMTTATMMTSVLHRPSVTSNNVYNIKIKMMNYLSDVDSTFAIFSSYELIKKVFIRYNTTLPSSAPVERLFSSAGLIETHRRNSLTDSIFEKLLLLKMNKL